MGKYCIDDLGMKIPFKKLLKHMNSVPEEYRDNTELHIKYSDGVGIYGIITYPVDDYRESYHNFILVKDGDLGQQSRDDAMEVFCKDQ